MIFVLGANGMLGRRICEELQRCELAFFPITRKQFEVYDEVSFLKYFKEKKPNIVINCVALTNVDYCEANVAEAFLVNSKAPQFMSDICYQYRVPFFHFSTDYVFDGNREEYYETDQPSPIQVYGLSKYQGEQAVLANHGFVIRLQAVYGPGRKNTTDWMLDSFRKFQAIPLSAIQIASPCSTLFLAKQIVYMIFRLTKPDLYHLSHDNYATRYQIGQFVVEGLALKRNGALVRPEELIIPQAGANFGSAKRPIKTILSNQKLKDVLGLKSLGTWEKDLINYVREVWKIPFFEKF